MIKYIISELSEVIIQGFMGIGKELSPILHIPLDKIELESIKEDSITFVKVLDKINAKPEETIFIDDLITNINVAESVGIQGIQFINAKKLEEDLINKNII